MTCSMIVMTLYIFYNHITKLLPKHVSSFHLFVFIVRFSTLRVDFLYRKDFRKHFNFYVIYLHDVTLNVFLKKCKLLELSKLNITKNTYT